MQKITSALTNLDAEDPPEDKPKLLETFDAPLSGDQTESPHARLKLIYVLIHECLGESKKKMHQDFDAKWKDWKNKRQFETGRMTM